MLWTSKFGWAIYSEKIGHTSENYSYLFWTNVTYVCAIIIYTFLYFYFWYMIMRSLESLAKRFMGYFDLTLEVAISGL